LSDAQEGAAYKHVPRSKEHERHAGGVHEVERVGDGDHVDLGYSNQLTVAAVDGIAQHGELRAEIVMAAHAPLAVIAEDHRGEQNAGARLDAGDVLARLDHLACHVAAENMRQLHPGQSFAYPQIKMVQRAGANSNQHVVLAQDGIRHLFVLQDLRPTELMNADCFHAIASSSDFSRSLEPQFFLQLTSKRPAT